jgi:hypothetical protein
MPCSALISQTEKVRRFKMKLGHWPLNQGDARTMPWTGPTPLQWHNNFAF